MTCKICNDEYTEPARVALRFGYILYPVCGKLICIALYKRWHEGKMAQRARRAGCRRGKEAL
jgi:hypothetical protein